MQIRPRPPCLLASPPASLPPSLLLLPLLLRPLPRPALLLHLTQLEPQVQLELVALLLELATQVQRAEQELRAVLRRRLPKKLLHLLQRTIYRQSLHFRTGN